MASLPLLVCIILCTYYSLAHGHGGNNEHSFVAVPATASEPEPVCSTSRRVRLDPGSNTVSVPLVHRHGPCAPTTTQSSDKPSFAERLRRNRARSKYILSRASKSQGMVVGTTRDAAANVSISTNLGGSVDSLEYVVTVGLGTPAVSQVVLIDTGSDLSWVQCKPCNSTACYPQKDPLFDPSKSSTYAPIPCDTDACRNLTGDGYGGGCTSGGGGAQAQCGFAITYGDGSQTSGVYSNETLTLAPGVAVEDFHFGCGHDQDGPNDKYDGLLGLGGAPESLVAQTSSVYGGAFSYCLPALNSQAGFLALGAPSASSSGFAFTPMILEDQTFYVVHMTGITVGGEPIDVPPSAFSGGMMIDSGTVVTELQHTAYGALQAAFRKAMAAYPLLPNGELDTCYNFTGYSNVTVPRVALTFSGGATVDLDVPDGILLDGCLAFQEAGPDDQLGILGNVNQRTLEVLYDTGRGRVGFRAAAC